MISMRLNKSCKPYLMYISVYERRNWLAWIDTSDSSTGTGRLNITGQIDLPSPGYSKLIGG